MSEELLANDEIQTIVDKVRSEIEARLGKAASSLKAVKYTSVSGQNFIKVAVDDNQYVHVGVDGDLKLTGFQDGKSESDKIEAL